MQRRPEFSFPGSPARGPLERARPPRPPVNHVAPRPAHEEEIRWLQASRQGSPDYASSGGDGSGTPSPQLWSHHEHRQYPASAGSSPSRAQAIAGYRREMLDLVRGLPESAYELSLRDIVEHHHRPPSPSSSSAPLPTPPLHPPPPPSSNAGAAVQSHEPATTGSEAEQGVKQSKKQGRKQQRAMRRQRSRSLERSVSLDTGLLIKFFMPLSLAGKKKVSPKPDASKDAKKKEKKQGTPAKREKEDEPRQQEEEWWNKSEFSEAGSSTRTSSTGSSNSNSSAGSVRNGGSNPPKAPVRSRSRKRNGCYAFFRPNKSKSGVSQD